MPAVVLYYLHENSIKINKEDIKPLLIGLALAILLCGIILATVSSMGNGFLGFDGLVVGGVQGNLGSTHDNSYNPDFGYYLLNMGNFISSSNTTFVAKTPALNNPTPLSVLVFLILIVGALLWIKRNDIEFNKTKIAGIILCLIALATFSQFSSSITIILAFFGLLLIGKDSENKMGYLMLMWILAYMIFQSYYIVKVNRYIIPIFPPMIYFLMIGVDEINAKINMKKILPIILIVFFLIQGFAFTMTFEETNEFNAPEKMTDYIKANIDNWSDIQIGNYNIRPYYWYLGLNTPGIEIGATQKIIDSGVSYYISNHKQKNLTNFTEIKQIDNLYLYKRNA